jgi:hypothetical protein
MFFNIQNINHEFKNICLHLLNGLIIIYAVKKIMKFNFNQLKLNNQIQHFKNICLHLLNGLNRVQHFFYIFLFNYMIRKANTYKIENQLNMETLV